MRRWYLFSLMLCVMTILTDCSQEDTAGASSDSNSPLLDQGMSNDLDTVTAIDTNDPAGEIKITFDHSQISGRKLIRLLGYLGS